MIVPISPFGTSPRNPHSLFAPHILDRYCFGEDRYMAPKHPLWPILIGLSKIKLDSLMAHITFGVDHYDRVVREPEHVLVQISTRSDKTNEEEGLPLVVKDGEVIVKKIWVQDEGKPHPLNLIDDPDEQTDLIIKDSDVFWEAFFYQKIREGKNVLLKQENNLREKSIDLQNEADKIREVLESF